MKTENIISAELPLIAEEVCLPSASLNKDLTDKKVDELFNDILLLVSEIETTYPELYKYLDETPLLEFSNMEDELNIEEFENYLITLKEQLLHHFNTHKINLSIRSDAE